MSLGRIRIRRLLGEAGPRWHDGNEIRGGVTSHELGVEATAVREGHLDGARALDDVVVGDDQAGTVDDEPRPAALLLRQPPPAEEAFVPGGHAGGPDHLEAHDARADALDQWRQRGERDLRRGDRPLPQVHLTVRQERERELALLEAVFAEVGAGAARVVLVTAEAGGGKTALIERFCAARAGSTRLLRGTCDALFTPRPLDSPGTLRPILYRWFNWFVELYASREDAFAAWSTFSFLALLVPAALAALFYLSQHAVTKLPRVDRPSTAPPSKPRPSRR